MARAFRDLLVREPDGKPRLTFRSRGGEAVLEDVSVELASELLQAGDRWGALAANQLLALDEEDAPYAIAPQFEPAAAPAVLASGEKLSTAFGKLAAAVTALIEHLADGTRHLTQEQILLAAHPVGSYYWSSDPTSPELLFGGSWIRILGRFVYAAAPTDRVGSTGGAKVVTLTAEQIPDHTHAINLQTEVPKRVVDGVSYPSGGQVDYQEKLSGSAYGTTSSGCGGKAHDNMPPYICAYCWRRTA